MPEPTILNSILEKWRVKLSEARKLIDAGQPASIPVVPAELKVILPSCPEDFAELRESARRAETFVLVPYYQLESIANYASAGEESNRPADVSGQ